MVGRSEAFQASRWFASPPPAKHWWIWIATCILAREPLSSHVYIVLLLARKVSHRSSLVERMPKEAILHLVFSLLASGSFRTEQGAHIYVYDFTHFGLKHPAIEKLYYQLLRDHGGASMRLRSIKCTTYYIPIATGFKTSYVHCKVRASNYVVHSWEGRG